MIRAHARVESETYSGLMVFIHLTDESGSGIHSVVLYDRDYNLVPIGQPTSCPQYFSDLVGPIDLRRLPLWIEAKDCAGVIFPPDLNGPLLYMLPGSPGLPMCGDPTFCLVPSTECNNGEAALAAARAALSPRCGQCEDLRRREGQAEWQFWVWFIAGLLTLAMAALAVSTGGILGFIVSLFIVALASYFLFEATQASQRARQLREAAELCEREVAELRREFELAQNLVFTYCCPECLIEPTTSPC
jgi:hypothetical protein